MVPSSSDDVTLSRDVTNSVFESLIEQLQSSTQPDSAKHEAAVATPLAENLLQLKTIHRQLFNSIQQAEAEYNRNIALQQKRQRNVDAVQYEKRQLEHRLHLLQNFSTPNMLRLAREEQDKEDEESNGNSMILDDADLLRTYFDGRDISNPEDRDFILRRLHDEINTRGTLEQAVKTKKEQLGKLLKELKSVTQVLTSLPQQVSAIERASMPLQKMFASSNSLTGSDRKSRIELAQSLPSPLYVLYFQLQQYTDFEQDDREESNRPCLGIEKNLVLLQLPVHDPSTSTSTPSGRNSSRRVTIQFAYEEASKVVTAVATGCGNLLLQDFLLQELFPGDAIPSSIRSSKALPFQWCNYLAGLYFLPTHQQQSQQPESPLVSCFPSTRVIVTELQRRVRANAVLKHVLQSLQRGVVPPLPSSVLSAIIELPLPENCKLAGFEALESEDSNRLICRYAVTLNHDASKSLNATVRIHKSRYPAVPPVWTLISTSATESSELNASNDPPLYDASLAEWEHRVNVAVIEQLSNSASSTTADSTFEWILVIQLRHIMSYWSASLLSSPSGMSMSRSIIRGTKRKAHDF